ncbi:MAG TPA: hypothetical protein VFE62_03090, partial [Gemmataceae bacterium]|nr:hypothetical protein [Gemmataceae bacterium]
MIYTLFIPRWHPTPLNKLLGNHFRAARLKKADREMVHWYCHINKIPHASGKRRVTLTIILKPGQRACDPDSPWKSCCDALVACGALREDN